MEKFRCIKEAAVLCGVCICVLALIWITANQEKSFFRLIGVTAAEVDQIRMENQQVAVELEADDCAALLECLQNAQGKRADYQDGYPYTPSEYAITLIAGEEEIEVTFSWFSGKEYVFTEWLDTATEIIVPKTIDNRFDICYQGQWYTFYQNEETIWNEERSQEAFKKSANRQGIKLTPRYEADGFMGETIHSVGEVYLPKGLEWQGKSAEQILLASELVVIATSTGLITKDAYPYECQFSFCNFESFEVKEILKGTVQEDELYMYQQYGPIENLVFYPPSEDPFYQKGHTYLLCLQKGPDLAGEASYEPTAGIFSTAVEQNGWVYPRYNTEYHPFAGIALDEIRQICHTIQ